MQEGSGAFGARVQAAIGLAPWAARVPPTERAGSEGSYIESLRWRGGRPAGASIIAACRQRPLWWLAPPPCPLGSVSLDSQSPCGSLRIQFPCHPPYSGGTMGAGQWRQFEFMAAAERKPYNRASPVKNKPTALRAWKCTPSAAFGGVSPGGGDLLSAQLLFS